MTRNNKTVRAGRVIPADKCSDINYDLSVRTFCYKGNKIWPVHGSGLLLHPHRLCCIVLGCVVNIQHVDECLVRSFYRKIDQLHKRDVEKTISKVGIPGSKLSSGSHGCGG